MKLTCEEELDHFRTAKERGPLKSSLAAKVNLVNFQPLFSKGVNKHADTGDMIVFARKTQCVLHWIETGFRNGKVHV